MKNLIMALLCALTFIGCIMAFTQDFVWGSVLMMLGATCFLLFVHWIEHRERKALG